MVFLYYDIQEKILTKLKLKLTEEDRGPTTELTTLTVKVVVLLAIEVPTGLASALSSTLTVREPEVVPEASGLLESLAEHLVLLDVIVGHGAPGELHGLLEVLLCDLWDRVLVIINVHSGSLLLSLLFPPDLGVDALPDGKLAGPLADLSQVGTGESLGHLGQEGQVDLLGDGALPQVGLEDGHPGSLVRQRDVDELVQTAGPQDGGVDDVWPVGGSDDEDVLLAAHPVHLSQDLVDDSV